MPVGVIIRVNMGAAQSVKYDDDAAWFVCEKGGAKGADCFYAHPTTTANFFAWNRWADGRALLQG